MTRNYKRREVEPQASADADTTNRPQVLREHLAAARRKGQPFDVAWPQSRRAAMRGLSGKERESWLSAFSSTEDAWADAYRRAPAKATHSALDRAA